MSVEVTRLPSGLTVVTDAMPHLETASLGVWVGVRQPRRAAGRARHLASARAHGVQGHQAPHRAPDRRGDRGGRRRPQCATCDRDHGLLRARAQGRRAARARRAVRHPLRTRPSIRTSSRASRTSSCRRSARPRIRRTTSCSTICRRRAFPDQPVGRSILGTPRDACARSTRTQLRAYLARNYRGPDMVVAAAGAVDHGDVRRRGRAAVRELRRRRRRRRREPARFGGGTDIEARDLEQVHIALALEGLPQRDPDSYSLQVFANVLGGGMSSRLFQEVREMRGLCYSIYAFHMPYSRHRLVRPLCRHRRQSTRRN